MTQCKCGGTVSKAVLSDGRDRWYCPSCKRWEAMGVPPDKESDQVIEARADKAFYEFLKIEPDGPWRYPEPIEIWHAGWRAALAHRGKP